MTGERTDELGAVVATEAARQIAVAHGAVAKLTRRTIRIRL